MSLPPLLSLSEATLPSWQRKVRDLVNLLAVRSVSKGPTGERPSNPDVGTQHYDVTLGKPVWWNGAAWTDASGGVA